jgi:PncC family amidohydrolase
MRTRNMPTHSGDLVEGLTRRGWTLAVAESLTGGLLADHFARLPEAGSWFRGGIVAYAEGVKRSLLDIGDAPVVSEGAARAMAETAARLLGAEVAVAVTGVGGPEGTGPHAASDGVASVSPGSSIGRLRGHEARDHSTVPHLHRHGVRDRRRRNTRHAADTAHDPTSDVASPTNKIVATRKEMAANRSA